MVYTGIRVTAFFPLVRFSKRRIGELFGARAGRLYGIGVALSFAVLIGFLPEPVSPSKVEDLLIAALKSASWSVAGFTALSAARDLGRRDDDDGILSLVAQRGHDPRSLELSRVLGAALWVASWVAGPALVLAAFAWTRLGDWSLWPWTFSWASFVLFYSASLGIAAGGLARGAARVTSWGRLGLIALVMAPELLRSVWPSVPSIPAAFAWALERAAQLDSVAVWISSQ